MRQTKTLPFKLDTPRVTLTPRAFVYTTPDIPFSLTHSLFISVAFFQGNPKKNPSPIWHRRNRPGFFAGGLRCACAKRSSLSVSLFFSFCLPWVGLHFVQKKKYIFSFSTSLPQSVRFRVAEKQNVAGVSFTRAVRGKVTCRNNLPCLHPREIRDFVSKQGRRWAKSSLQRTDGC